MSCIIVIIVVVFQFCAIGIYLAEGQKNEEKLCINTNVFPHVLRRIDTRRFECKGGVPVKKGPPDIPSTPVPSEQPESIRSFLPENAPLPLHSSETYYTGPCENAADELLCYNNLHCGKASGYECCGSGKVHPATQTCCMQMHYRFRVHEHMQAKKHVCCGLNAFKRSRSVPCHSAAKNDGFWRGAKPVKKLLKTRKHCNGYDHVVLIKIGDKGNEPGRMFHASTIRLIQNGRLSNRTLNKDIPIDTNSPKRSLRRKWFLVYSRVDPVSSTLDFYLRPDDLVFKGNNGKVLKRKARAAHNICRVILTTNRKVKNKGRKRRRKNSRKNNRVRHL